MSTATNWIKCPVEFDVLVELCLFIAKKWWKFYENRSKQRQYVENDLCLVISDKISLLLLDTKDYKNCNQVTRSDSFN